MQLATARSKLLHTESEAARITDAAAAAADASDRRAAAVAAELDAQAVGLQGRAGVLRDAEAAVMETKALLDARGGAYVSIPTLLSL